MGVTESGMVVKDDCGLWMGWECSLATISKAGYWLLYQSNFNKEPNLSASVTVCSRVIHVKNCLSQKFCLKM